MPYKTQVFLDSRLISTTVVKSLEMNKGLSDDLFDPDKVEVKGFDMQEMMKKNSYIARCSRKEPSFDESFDRLINEFENGRKELPS